MILSKKAKQRIMTIADDPRGQDSSLLAFTMLRTNRSYEHLCWKMGSFKVSGLTDAFQWLINRYWLWRMSRDIEHDRDALIKLLRQESSKRTMNGLYALSFLLSVKQKSIASKNLKALN